MNKEVSAYLDCTRVLGTLLVFFAHTEVNWIAGTGKFFIPLGNEALAIMFMVSGFVIGFVSDKREANLKSYLVHRSARAYSLLIPCLIFAWILDCVGKHWMPHYYHVGSWPPLSSDTREALKALFSLTFLGESWGANVFPGSMAPYWTFPYEWTFYLMFGALWYLRGVRRVLILLVLAAIAGPWILMFFPLWFLGTITYWLSKRLDLSMRTGKWVFFSTLAVIATVQTMVYSFHLDFGFGVEEEPELWPFYLSALLFACSVIGFRFSGLSISRYTGWVQWLAGGTGTIYLLHMPLGRFVNGFIPYTLSPLVRWPLLVLPVLAISLLFAEFNEKRREVWRRKIEAGFDYIQRLLRTAKGRRASVTT